MIDLHHLLDTSVNKWVEDGNQCGNPEPNDRDNNPSGEELVRAMYMSAICTAIHHSAAIQDDILTNLLPKDIIRAIHRKWPKDPVPQKRCNCPKCGHTAPSL